MKKKDVVNAVSKKNISSNKKKTNSTKKTTTKKRNYNKKKSTSNRKKDAIVVVDEKVVEMEEDISAEESSMEEEQKKEKTPKQKLIGFFMKLIIIIVLLIILLLTFLTLTEYKPNETSKVKVNGDGFQDLLPESTFDIMTWNIGYGALGDNADYYKDGGEMVITANRTRIDKNMKNIISKIDEVHPSVFFIQEVDVYSKRSSHVNELTSIAHSFNAYSYSYARDYKAMYIPFPLKETIGSVDSGIATFSKYKMNNSKRISLPNYKIWPFSTVEHKRALLVSYIPIKDSDKKLVLINLHLEDYEKEVRTEEQIKVLADLLKDELANGNYVIAGGDFNHVFSNIENDKWETSSLDISKFKGDLQFVMDKEVPTSRSLEKPYIGEDKEKFPYYLVDGYIVSGNITINSIKTQDLGFVSSNHNPVVLNITLK